MKEKNHKFFIHKNFISMSNKMYVAPIGKTLCLIRLRYYQSMQRITAIEEIFVGA